MLMRCMDYSITVVLWTNLSGIVNRDEPRLFTPLLVSTGGPDNGANADTVWKTYLKRKG